MVESIRVASFPNFAFPNGSFAATPCSCDIAIEEAFPPNVKELLRNANGDKGKRKGHSASVKVG